MIRSLSFAVLVSMISNQNLFAGEADDPDDLLVVEIISPTGEIRTNAASATIQVRITMRQEGDDNGDDEGDDEQELDDPVRLELRVNGVPVSGVEIPDDTRLPLDHAFGLDLTAFPNQMITVQAVAIIGEIDEEDVVEVGSAAVNIIIDFNPPQIVGLVPTSGSVLTTPRPLISATVSDTGGSGLDGNNIALFVNGILVPATINFQSISLVMLEFMTLTDLGLGSNSVTVAAGDRAGNAAIPVTSTFTRSLVWF